MDATVRNKRTRRRIKKCNSLLTISSPVPPDGVFYLWYTFTPLSSPKHARATINVGYFCLFGRNSYLVNHAFGYQMEWGRRHQFSVRVNGADGDWLRIGDCGGDVVADSYGAFAQVRNGLQRVGIGYLCGDVVCVLGSELHSFGVGGGHLGHIVGIYRNFGAALFGRTVGVKPYPWVVIERGWLGNYFFAQPRSR